MDKNSLDGVLLDGVAFMSNVRNQLSHPYPL